VVNAFLETRPQLDATFNELWALPPAAGHITKLTREMNFPIALPPELGSAGPMQLRAIAEGRELGSAS
jgi:hypothetical protein